VKGQIICLMQYEMEKRALTVMRFVDPLLFAEIRLIYIASEAIKRAVNCHRPQ
jgi:hypothetical protein